MAKENSLEKDRALSRAKPTDEIVPASYGAVLDEIRQRIRTAQLAALRAVNRELVGLYWEIGRLIVERQQSETWGMSIVERLAADIRDEFPGLGGFSARNVWYMRNLYAHYQGSSQETEIKVG